MTPENVPQLTQYMGAALVGSLVSQIAYARGLDLEEVMGGPAHELSPSATRIAHELQALGVHPAILGGNALEALRLLLLNEQNADLLIEQFARLLWSTLGDPATGGSTPPDIYRRAGCALHLVLVGLLSPENEPFPAHEHAP